MPLPSDTAAHEETVNAVDRLPDSQLLDCVKSLAVHERHATSRLIAALAEVERRRLYLGQGCSSLYSDCTDVLGFSADAAYSRVQAARAGLRFPIVLRDLESGALTLTAVRLLAPVLTPERHLELLDAVRHRPTREISTLVATMVSPADLFHFIVPQTTHGKFVEAQALLRHALPDGGVAAVFDRAVDALEAFSSMLESASARTLALCLLPRA